jgi:hypothetical protein
VTTFSMNKAIDPSPDGGVLAALNPMLSHSLEEQVVEYFGTARDLSAFDEFVLPRLPVVAILALPVLEKITGLPVLTLYSFDQECGTAEVTGRLDLAAYTTEIVGPRQTELPTYEQVPTYDGYTVLDGTGRGMTADQLAGLAEKMCCREQDIRVLNASMGRVDLANPTAGMVDKLISTGVSRIDLAYRSVLYLPAGNALVAALQAATIYGLSKAWPRTIRLNRHGRSEFRFEEVLDPQALGQVGARLGV